MAEAIVSTLKAKIKANDEELQMFQDKWETTPYFILTDHCFSLEPCGNTWMCIWHCSLGVRTPASSWTLRSRQGRRLKPRWSDSDIKVIVLRSFISDARWTTARERWRCWRRRLRKMTRGEHWVVLTHQFVISTRKLDLKFCSTHYVGNDHISSKMIPKWLWILQIWEHFIKVAERFWSFCWVRRSQVLFHILFFCAQENILLFDLFLVPLL